ncbi:MAG: hypothetical protein U0807_00210 [Candidatus Binatia bacterium]
MSHVVGIELTDDEIRFAHAARARLISVERHPLSDASLRDLAARIRTFGPTLVRTVLPAHATTHRLLSLPFRDRARQAQVVPLELAGQLPAEASDAVTAFAPVGSDGAVLAAIARRLDVETVRSHLARAGVACDGVTLAPLPVLDLVPPAYGDVAVIVADGPRSAVVVRRGGTIAGLRALAAPGSDLATFAREVRWSLTGLGGPPAVVLMAGSDATAGLEDALAAALAVRVEPLPFRGWLPARTAAPAAVDLAVCAVAIGLALGSGVGPDFAPSPDGAGVTRRRVRTLAAAALVLTVLDLGLVRHGLVRRDAVLARTITAEAAAALPGVRIVAARTQLESAVATAERRRGQLGGSLSVLELLRDVSERLPATLRLDLEEIAVGPDAFRLHGRAESFDAVDALRRALMASPLLDDVTADETRTTVDGTRIAFRLHATRRTTPGAPS